MGFDRIRIKENAQKHYNINKWNNVLVILILSAVGWVLSFIIRGSTEYDYKLLAGVGSIESLTNIFLTNVITMGATVWFHKAIHTDKLGVDAMFCTFKEKYLDNVLLQFLKGLFIILWTMLLFVPGIIAAYKYSLADYIKMENPDISASRAIDISINMTNGHKADLFVLDLSFFGWFLLSGLTCGILYVVYVGPYYYAAKAFAYEEIKAEAIASGRVNPAELGC